MRWAGGVVLWIGFGIKLIQGSVCFCNLETTRTLFVIYEKSWTENVFIPKLSHGLNTTSLNSIRVIKIISIFLKTRGTCFAIFQITGTKHVNFSKLSPRDPF